MTKIVNTKYDLNTRNIKQKLDQVIQHGINKELNQL